MTLTPLRPGLLSWTARYPGWGETDDPAQHGWGPDVTCYALTTPSDVVLVDPVIPGDPQDLEEVTAGRTVTTLLTCPWHERDAVELGYPIVSPSTEGEDRSWTPARTYAGGDAIDLPGGVEAVAHPGLEPVDLVLWLPAFRALLFGDTLIDRGAGLELPDRWGPAHIDHGPVLAGLRALVDELPVELALPTHGAAADGAALRRAVG